MVAEPKTLYRNRAGTIGALGLEHEVVHKMVLSQEIKIPKYSPIKHEFSFVPSCRVDFVLQNPKTLEKAYLEVKSWELRIRDVMQIVKYVIHMREQHICCPLIVLCACISPIRENILALMGVRVYLIKDCCKNVNSFDNEPLMVSDFA